MKICFITGSRAEYGLLAPLMKKFKGSKKHELIIIATGMHLSKKHGETFKEILSDKLKINHFVKINQEDDKPNDICHSLNSAINKFSNIFRSLKTDLIVLLGDRYEIYSLHSSFNSSNTSLSYTWG